MSRLASRLTSHAYAIPAMQRAFIDNNSSYHLEVYPMVLMYK